MRSQITQSPEPPTLAALRAMFEADDQMPEALHAASAFPYHGTVVVLLDGPASWPAWIVAVQERAEEHQIAAQVGLHVSTAEATVCGCPVIVVCGDCAEALEASVPPCTCLGGVQHAVTAADKRITGDRLMWSLEHSSADLAEYYGARLAECESSARAARVAARSAVAA